MFLNIPIYSKSFTLYMSLIGRLIDEGIIRELSQDFDLSNKPKGLYRIQVSNDKAMKTLNVVI